MFVHLPCFFVGSNSRCDKVWNSIPCGIISALHGQVPGWLVDSLIYWFLGILLSIFSPRYFGMLGLRRRERESGIPFEFTEVAHDIVWGIGEVSAGLRMHTFSDKEFLLGNPIVS